MTVCSMTQCVTRCHVMLPGDFDAAVLSATGLQSAGSWSSRHCGRRGSRGKTD